METRAGVDAGEASETTVVGAPKEKGTGRFGTYKSPVEQAENAASVMITIAQSAFVGRLKTEHDNKNTVQAEHNNEGEARTGPRTSL